MDSAVDVFELADEVQHGALFAGRKRMKKPVAFRILVQHLLKLLGHGHAIFAVVSLKPDLDEVPDVEAKVRSAFLIDNDVEDLTPGHKGAGKAFGTIDRAKDPL